MFRSIAFIGLLMFSPVVASAQQPCTSDARRVVDELYRHMLERSPDAGSAGMVERLSNGRVTVRDLVRELAKSPEHTQRFWTGQNTHEAVGTLYRHILGRQPDPQGQRDFADMASRRGVGAVVDDIMRSAEYQNSFGANGVPGSGGMVYCRDGSTTTSSIIGTTGSDQMRFPGMDTNNDGVIQQSEWRGNLNSFRVHDWNNDGVLSGDEVRVGAGRRGRTQDDLIYDRDERFDYLDANNNGVIERSEWHQSLDAFDRLDRNNDAVLSRTEFVGRRR